MPGDLWYFHECDLDRTDLEDFYKSLPSHLRSVFKASLHAGISKGNVLQGYRGPSEMCNGGSGDSGVSYPFRGLQEIKFWWGARKDMNFLPVIGTGIFVLGRTCQSLSDELAWSSLYFDSKTGECLSHDKNEAAEKLNNIGCRLAQEGQYSEAAKYHSNAYRACSKGYHKEQKFKNNADKAKSKQQQKSRSYQRDDDEDDEDYSEWSAPSCAPRSSNYDRVQSNYYTDSFATYEPSDTERKASALCLHGKYLFQNGRYSDAEDTFREAYFTSKFNYDRHLTILYHSYWQAARKENDAMTLHSQGDHYFKHGLYTEARDKYEEAFNQSCECERRQLYKEQMDKAERELAARNEHQEGLNFFEHGLYAHAEEKFSIAYRHSNVSTDKQTYHVDMNRAGLEANAGVLNSQGYNSFMQGDYSAAKIQYQRAFDTSQIRKNKQVYQTNRIKAQAEIDALNLNSEGEHLFNQGNYEKAHSKYQQACDTSQISKHKQVYQTNRIEAQAEIDAMNLNSQGNALFSQARYNESYSKYNEACNKSRVSANNNVYAANRSKAQAEINAIDLNSEGNDLFNRGNYEEAHSKYQQAYDKSQKDIYSGNREKVQTVLNKLSILGHLWAEAWDAENDTSNDRCEEAKDIFQRILNECKDFLIIFPRNSKFEQYRTLALLKIQGNETFNQGIVLRQNGMTLFETAQQLRQQENYQLANEKFKEAKRYFQKAFEKFEAGKISDQRFESCIDFVQEHIKVVTESIEITEQCILRASLQMLDLDNGSNDHSARDSCESGGPAVYNNYSQQIN